MKIGDTVKTEYGIGQIVEEEIHHTYILKRFGVKIDGLSTSWYTKSIMFFFENHLVLIEK